MVWNGAPAKKHYFFPVKYLAKFAKYFHVGKHLFTPLAGHGVLGDLYIYNIYIYVRMYASNPVC